VPAALHLEHPVKASSPGDCSIGAVPNPVITYGVSTIKTAPGSPVRWTPVPGRRFPENMCSWERLWV